MIGAGTQIGRPPAGHPAVVVALAALLVAPWTGAARAAERGLPDGGPPALHSEPPRLPAPTVWPFAEGFPRTSGTGRYADGAYYWTDFLYDDHGAVAGPPRNESAGAVSFGSYRYPRPEQAGNGADLFRLAVGLDDRRRTWWRVDWNTLVDASVPAAAFVMDTDADDATGVAAWPAGANVSSAGIEQALVVSGTGAWLHDLEAGTRVPVADVGGSHHVDVQARSFVVSLPDSALPVTGTWRIRAAGGLADADGDAFLQLTPEHGARPGGASLYNVAYRGYDDEPAEDNFWFDMTQAERLTAGDVTPLSTAVDWAALATGRTDGQPRPTGWSNRYYVSSVEPGHGRVQGEASTADGEPNYLGRVQPYGVWLPSGLDGGQPAPLTWLLHSFTINHNQYAATAPRTLHEVCEERGSVCATPLGRGPDGQYRGVAELDFWEVWADLATHVPLDPHRTVIGGYSMGGFGTWRIAAMHPDLFAAMFLLSSAATDDLPLADNLRHVPYYHDHGALDELVPLSEARETIDALDALGYRYVFDLHPAEDHIAYSLKDGWRQLAEWLVETDRVVTGPPGRIDYTWFPADVDDDLGIGPDGGWWLRGLVARDDGGPLPRVTARSDAVDGRGHRARRSREVLADAAPSPAVRERLTWEPTHAAPRRPRIGLDLSNVGALALDVTEAGLDPAVDEARVAVTTDGRSTLRLPGVPAGLRVLLDGEPVAVTPPTPTVDIPDGTHIVTFASALPGDAPAVGERAPLPATGGGSAVGLVLGVAGVLLWGWRLSAARRRLPRSR